ncbi:DivIVA domain-containing protein [Propioniciclava flava]
MTLTIEQVRDTRFHLARRNGYDPADVNTFVDKVETTLVALGEEIATLQQQVSTLSASGGGSDGGEWRQQVEAKDAEIERLRQELNAARSGQSSDAAALQRQLDEAREQLQARDGDLAAQLRAKDDELAQQAAAIQSKDEEIARCQEEIANLHNSLAGGGDKAAHLESELTGRDQQIAQLRVQVQDLRGEVSSREAELLTLRGQLKQVRRQRPVRALRPPGSWRVRAFSKLV